VSVTLQIKLIMQKYKYLRDLKPMNQRGQSRGQTYHSLCSGSNTRTSVSVRAFSQRVTVHQKCLKCRGRRGETVQNCPISVVKTGSSMLIEQGPESKRVPREVRRSVTQQITPICPGHGVGHVRIA
jgi:hypothetical protein